MTDLVRTADALFEETDALTRMQVHVVTCDDNGLPKSESLLEIERLLTPISLKMRAKSTMARLNLF